MWTVPWLLRRSLVAAFDDNCFSIAKGAAYSALLSFFPVLTSAAVILVQTRAEFVGRTLEGFLTEVLPPGTHEVVVEQFQVRGARPLPLLVVAGLISLWAASSVVKSLIEGFQAAYRVPRNRSFLQGSAVAIALVLISCIPLLGASALVLFGGRIERLVLGWMSVDPRWTPFAWVWVWLSWLARYVVAFGATVLVTGLLYYFGPYRKQRWSYVWPGAVVATVLWLLATSGFGWYVSNLANYNVLYGSVATSIALLVWMYLIAAIALVGCEFNAERERLAESRMLRVTSRRP
ncbi:MAG TPA: YihY/virulence factor BrkB family protein [Bryobacteraceae bacterium]|nr:YihY/virulence factor BrkB family protein [Bryobacteraceae bacterium]